MSNDEVLESHMIKLGAPYERVGDGTWVLVPDDARRAQVGIQLEDPIVLFSIHLFELGQATPDREGLFRRLLELNSELVHTSYALEGEQVVLSGARQVQSMDFDEFQAMIDDMSMALDNHYDKLSSWVSTKDPQAEGNA